MLERGKLFLFSSSPFDLLKLRRR